MQSQQFSNQKNATTPGKIKDRINGTSSIRSAYETMEGARSWSENTLSSYGKNISILEDFMVENNIEPIIENIDFELVQQWVKFLREKKRDKPKTIKQRVATMSSIFSFFKDLGVFGANPFLAIKVQTTDVGHHSRVMNFEEVFTIYSSVRTEPELMESELPIHLDLMTGLRNVTLCKLTADSISNVEKGIQYGELEEENGNEPITELNTSKFKKGFIPLPPVLLQKVNQYVEDMNLTGKNALLYGVQGKPLANKQFNHMVKKLCNTLQWDDDKKITPYAFRYTFATMLGEMGVSDDAIRYALGHGISSSKGSLARYVRMDHKYKKEIRIAQTILEEVLETLFMLQEHHLMNVNIKQLYQELPDLYQHALRNEQSITQFKFNLIELAQRNKQMEMMNMKGQSSMQTGAPQLLQSFQGSNPFINQPGSNAPSVNSYQMDPNMIGVMIQQLYQMMQVNTNQQQQTVFHSGGQYSHPSSSQSYMQHPPMFPPVS
ncbi:tyrosine-type recombinase/integrase [Mesobacillus maritimus]|uniref:tyrosine-type recombinase/integrase n=1 Tax=Mesobacillus maritimus TaxID=1643336 RepID=UPI002041EB13|nr:tyrosine-type recombinase/integrase [Mesobacillus maritimus]MCM3584222.1 tyrosine-type recombinase/integrase [Mesobacillus maritimus]